MVVKKCPSCAAQVEVAPGEKPVCPSCGYGRSNQTAEPAALTAPPMHGGALTSGSRPEPGRLRTISIGKSVLFGILTLGIYTLVMAFKMSGDLARATDAGDGWQILFWLGVFLPYVGFVLLLILYFKNNKRSNQVREAHAMTRSFVPFILAVIPLVNIVAPFVWASHYNEVAQRT